MAQVAHACRSEYACTMSDILSRRTRLSQVDVLAAYKALNRIASLMAQELKWSPGRLDKELEVAEEFLKTCGLEHALKHRGPTICKEHGGPMAARLRMS